MFLRRTFEASGHDMHSLLFNFLDELLFVFSTELFVPVELQITEFDRSQWRIHASGCALRCNFNAAVVYVLQGAVCAGGAAHHRPLGVPNTGQLMRFAAEIHTAPPWKILNS